jgi:hypothetical protein
MCYFSPCTQLYESVDLCRDTVHLCAVHVYTTAYTNDDFHVEYDVERRSDDRNIDFVFAWQFRAFTDHVATGPISGDVVDKCEVVDFPISNNESATCFTAKSTSQRECVVVVNPVSCWRDCWRR